ncbi:MAG TPA: TIGR02281 family clan AA aspartic protease [Gammaproteobacteria bacterium]|nr:TIGR02281 family clan AA aspartic protease [Gammaproteobacteria bacterium]
MNAHHQAEKGSQRRMGFGMIVLAWLLILGILSAYFSGWLGEQRNPNQSIETLVTAGGAREVVLKQNRFGHYVASGQINGVSATFLLDTGATDVSVPAELAEKAGLEAGPPARAQTAAGVITTRMTRIDRVELGGIVLEDVRAHINPRMRGDEVLLGMSFLRQLEFTQRGDELTLRQRQPAS